MANLLDEVTGPVNDDGRDVNVINRQIPVTVLHTNQPCSR